MFELHKTDLKSILFDEVTILLSLFQPGLLLTEQHSEKIYSVMLISLWSCYFVFQHVVHTSDIQIS